MSQFIYGMALFVSCIGIWSVGCFLHFLMEQVKRMYRK